MVRKTMKSKDMDSKQLETVFDNFYNMENCGLRDAHYDWKEENRDIISNAITNYYETFIHMNSSITDGKEMFEHWAYEFFRSKWVFRMQNDNWKEFPMEML